jgi:hypothetical protein
MSRYNPDTHHRHSLRLQGYDYSEAGAYFVTVCTQNRECMFGEIVDEKVILNNAGRMVESIWNELSQHYECVETDEFVVMPNHFHGIIVRVGAGLALPRIDTTIRQNQGAASSTPTLDRQRDFPYFFPFFLGHPALFVKIPKLTIQQLLTATPHHPKRKH